MVSHPYNLTVSGNANIASPYLYMADTMLTGCDNVATSTTTDEDMIMNDTTNETLPESMPIDTVSIQEVGTFKMLSVDEQITRLRTAEKTTLQHECNVLVCAYPKPEDSARLRETLQGYAEKYHSETICKDNKLAKKDWSSARTSIKRAGMSLPVHIRFKWSQTGDRTVDISYVSPEVQAAEKRAKDIKEKAKKAAEEEIQQAAEEEKQKARNSLGYTDVAIQIERHIKAEFGGHMLGAIIAELSARHTARLESAEDTADYLATELEFGDDDADVA